MALDKIGICNEALAELPEQAIESFDEGTVAAEWAARRYSPALAYLLEMHDWKTPVERVTLALVDNDRPAEWRHAYALPGNVAAELRIFPASINNPSQVPLLAGQALAYPVRVNGAALEWAYLLSGSKLYTNVGDAVLEYARDDPNETTFSALFAHALSLELASRLAMPILKGDKGSKRQRELRAMAEVARDRAIADMRNRDPSESQYGDFVNESEAARFGAYPGFGATSWDVRWS